MRETTISRRRFMKTTALATAAAFQPLFWIPRSASAAQELRVWTYNNFITKEFRQSFESETGIRIRVKLIDDQGKELNLLVAEKPNFTADVVTVAGHRFPQFINQGTIEPLDESKIKSWETINPVYREADWMIRDGKRWGVPILMGSEGMAYNEEKMGKVDTWDVMFDERYKGKIAYQVQDFLSIAMQYLGYDGTMVSYLKRPEVGRRAVEATKNFLIKHKHLVRAFYDSGAQVQQMFINEDIWVAQCWSGPAARLIMDGFPIRYTIPREGGFGFVYTFSVVKGARNRENAYKFLNAIMSDPRQGTYLTKATGFVSTFVGAEKGLTELERKASSLSQEELERITFFSPVAVEFKYKLFDRAVEEIKAA
ncbi:MAG: extracellular solute-binding protein [Nitrospinota bacterium]|nr:MAG: extracellular solute-binding protein [Nitrospinota bacterium]